MSKQLALWLFLNLLFVTVFVIAVFFLENPVTRVLLGFSGLCGIILSIMMVTRISKSGGPRK